jgi:predicted TIM-barrel fold metal-dependent hydrolase
MKEGSSKVTTITNGHMHLMSADCTPAIQLYYLVRDILIKLVRKRRRNISVAKLETRTRIPVILNVTIWAMMVLTAPRVRRSLAQFVSFLTRVSNISVAAMVEDPYLGELFGRKQRLVGSKIRRFLVRQGKNGTTLKDTVILLVCRLYKINNASGARKTQRDLLASFLSSLRDTPIYHRLVVLSMDFDSAFTHVHNPGFPETIEGEQYNVPRTKFGGQLAELADLARPSELRAAKQMAGYEGSLEVLPFMCVDPRSYPSENQLLGAVTDAVSRGIRGIKLYPPLGYLPEDGKLQGLYRYCMANDIPVLTHCSVGGAGRKGAVNCAELAHPYYWIPVIDRLLQDNDGGTFRLCLGHFGTVAEEKHFAWWDEIVELISSYAERPEIKIFSDISANFPKKRNAKAFFRRLHQTIWSCPLLRRRILFGSDWWMQLFVLSEREYIDRVFDKWSGLRYYPGGNAAAFMKQLESNADAFLGKAQSDKDPT